MEHTIRAYDEAQDLDPLVRCWMEIGWIDSAEKKTALQAFFAGSNVEVGVVDDTAEAMTMWTPGTVRHGDGDLPLAAVTAVTVSHVARKLGLASRLTARALQQSVAAGFAVAALGMFEQGFYDRLGFGTGSYDNEVMFDPAALELDHVPYRQPVRITPEQYADLSSAMRRRLTSHGAVTLEPELTVKGEMLIAENPFALGYRDESGELTHAVFGTMSGEYGPYRVNAIAYRSVDQLVELLRMLRELGDQVRSIKMIEPAHVQLQALLREPMRESDRSKGSVHQSMNRSLAWWQIRMLDVPACVAASSGVGEDVRFNLSLTDPVEAHLADGWQGVGGDYTITIGEKSSATLGHTDGLPLMETGVGSFTRLWLGVRSATGLVATDPISAPHDLLVDLDRAIRLPRPLPGWEY